jgi:hypothetical protein
MHWSSVRPEMATTGSSSFPHFVQRVMHSMTDTPIFRPQRGTGLFVPFAC